MRYLMVGGGFRAQLVMSVAGQLGWEQTGLVTRRPTAAASSRTDLAAAIRETRPDLVLAAVPSPALPGLAPVTLDATLPLVTETPLARNQDDLDDLLSLAEGTGLIQVLEQYPRFPLHAARLAVARAGLIGQVSQVQVSSTQTYHAVALIRAGLSLPPGVLAHTTTTRLTAPLVQPLDRAGWTHDGEAHPATTTIGLLDFGPAGSGVYDFTEGQTRNLLRHRRFVIRGSHGEIDGDRLVRLAGPEQIVTERFERRQTGHDLDLNGYQTASISLGGEVLWTNRWPDLRLNDDELAVADYLTQTQAWLRGEAPEPYSLAEAAADTRLGFALDPT